MTFCLSSLRLNRQVCQAFIIALVRVDTSSRLSSFLPSGAGLDSRRKPISEIGFAESRPWPSSHACGDVVSYTRRNEIRTLLLVGESNDFQHCYGYWDLHQSHWKYNRTGLFRTIRTRPVHVWRGRSDPDTIHMLLGSGWVNTQSSSSLIWKKIPNKITNK